MPNTTPESVLSPEEREADAIMYAMLAEWAKVRTDLLAQNPTIRKPEPAPSEPLATGHSEQDMAAALVDVLDLDAAARNYRQNARARAAGLKLAGDSVSIGDLPDRPRSMVAVGDWVEIVPFEGEPVAGFVDRVTAHHLSVRPHPQVIRGQVRVHSVDWRDRGHWKHFKLRKKGEEGLSESLTNRSRPALASVSGAPDPVESSPLVIPYHPVVAATPKLELSEPEYTQVNNETVDDLENLLRDTVFATRELSPPDAWREARSEIRARFTGLDEADMTYLKGKFRKLKKRISSVPEIH